MQATEFIASLDKAELHLHIEGSLEPEMMFEMAKRNGVSFPFSSVEAVRDAYDFEDLKSFLKLYYRGMDVLLTEIDFYELTTAYLRRVWADNCRHVEIFFDPQPHLSKGLTFGTFFQGIYKALSDFEVNNGLTFRIIMCFLRDRSEEDAFVTLEAAAPFLDKIDGIGLDSAEVGHPPVKFKHIFREVETLGLKKVAHAGEEGPPEYIWQALDILGVDRIDHGIRSIEDPDLLKRLASDAIPLTVCPLSNYRLKTIKRLQDHPIKKLHDHGLVVTINSDDPSYFGGYINDNFEVAHTHMGLTRDDLKVIAENSLKASFQ